MQNDDAIKKELDFGAGQVLLERKDIPDFYKWDLSSIYADENAFESDFDKVKSMMPKISEFAGRLSEGPAVLLECLKLRDEISITLGKLFVYAHMKSHEDTADSKRQGAASRVSVLSVSFSSAASYIVPEILKLPCDVLDACISDSSLSEYVFMIKNIIRMKDHVLSEAEELIVAKAGDVTGIADNVFSMLTNADMRFPKIKDESGCVVEMSEERAVSYLRSRKRRVRKDAFYSLYKPYGEMKNTLGAAFDGMLKSSAFSSGVRKYSSCLAMALDGDNIPESVYNNLIDTIESNLEPMHSYMDLRKKVLRVKELHMYDLYTPLVEDPFGQIPWTDAKAMMFSALTPLGDEYIGHVKEGIENGWADVFPNKGKRGGAYSWGSYGTHPYLLMNYTNNLSDVSTLVHEIGHSMHSFYSKKNQPYATSDYCIFTAEVASTTNEVLFLSNLISENTKVKKKLYLLNKRLENIRTTVYRQTMFASFEREVHRRYAVSEDTTPDGLMSLWFDLNRKYYGPDIVIDDALKMEWARIPHFYNPFYVYQYATGFSAATALAESITKNGTEARDRYLRFLTKGGSNYPIELLKEAGADMSTPLPVLNVIEIFRDTLLEMEALLNKKS